MFIAILSVNHKKAPITVREKIAFSTNTIIDATKKLNQLNEINASVILATCNRTEIYISSKKDNIKTELTQFLSDYHTIKTQYLEQYLEFFTNQNAVNHICQVASGIDSLVIGEPQILGQLKNAYLDAKKIKPLDKVLEKLFQHAFSTAKKVRTNTKIGQNPISIAYCGIKLSEKIFSDISLQNALLIGAGEMIELSAKYLHQKKIKKIIIANRTKKNVEKLTKKYNGEVINLSQINDYIFQADIIITSTAAPLAIIGKGLVESAIKKRKHKPMFILDLAVPRDVEEQVANLPDVYLYTIDDLNQVIDNNLNYRKQAKNIAIEIINQQDEIFMHYLTKLPQQDLIKNYQKNAQIIKNQLLNTTLKKINDENTKLIITKLVDQLTSKLIHQNFINLKKIELDDIEKCNNCIPKL